MCSHLYLSIFSIMQTLNTKSIHQFAYRSRSICMLTRHDFYPPLDYAPLHIHLHPPSQAECIPISFSFCLSIGSTIWCSISPSVGLSIRRSICLAVRLAIRCTIWRTVGMAVHFSVNTLQSVLSGGFRDTVLRCLSALLIGSSQVRLDEEADE